MPVYTNYHANDLLFCTDWEQLLCAVVMRYYEDYLVIRAYY